jgi:nitrite reductase/ring-hydroxylating ferredoxin subunit
MPKKNFKKHIALTFLSIIIASCGNDYNFPNVDVNITIPITMPQYNNIYGNLWGYEYLNGGLGGIIVVQGMDGFLAYDRSCTFEANSECIISGQSINDPILSCENCCNSKFIITDGSVTEGPANQALKKYNTFFDGEILYITN